MNLEGILLTATYIDIIECSPRISFRTLTLPKATLLFFRILYKRSPGSIPPSQKNYENFKEVQRSLKELAAYPRIGSLVL